MIDRIVPRLEMKEQIGTLLRLLQGAPPRPRDEEDEDEPEPVGDAASPAP